MITVMEASAVPSFVEDSVVKLTQPQLVWDVATEAPELAQALAERDPAVAALCASLRKSLPVLRHNLEIVHPPFVRPSGHHRCFYIDATVGGGKGVVAVKGTEVHAENFPDWMKQQQQSRVHVEGTVGSLSHTVTESRAEMRGIDKWPVVEGKVPGGYLTHEALGDAKAAAAFQRAYYARYGEPARAPFPLLVFRWPDEARRRVWDELAPRLADRARGIVERLLQDGLACYVYHYPTLPLRLAHLRMKDVNVSAGLTYPGRVEALSSAKFGQLDVGAIIDRWLELVARMLAVGFFPKDAGSTVTGDCLQFQNAVLDGGFADVESLIAMERIGDERELHDALVRSVQELTATVCRLLLGLSAPSRELRDRMPEMFTFVWNDLARRVADEAKRGSIDARLTAALSEPRSLFAQLDRVFRLFFC